MLFYFYHANLVFRIMLKCSATGSKIIRQQMVRNTVPQNTLIFKIGMRIGVEIIQHYNSTAIPENFL